MKFYGTNYTLFIGDKEQSKNTLSFAKTSAILNDTAYIAYSKDMLNLAIYELYIDNYDDIHEFNGKVYICKLFTDGDNTWEEYYRVATDLDIFVDNLDDIITLYNVTKEKTEVWTLD